MTSFLEELMTDNNADMRGEIKRYMWAYSKSSGKSPRVCWALLYEAFEKETKIRLPHLNKLDFIIKKGLLDTLYGLVYNNYR